MIATASPPEDDPVRLALRCPVCGAQLGPDGLTQAHLARDVRRHGWLMISAALVDLHTHHVRFVRVGVAADETSTSPLSRRIVDALSRGRTMRLGEIAAAVGERTTACRTALTRLIDRGLVDCPKRGHYRWLDGGAA